jgi:hypothetical protein
LPAFKDLATSNFERVKTSGVKIYPNPAKDWLTIETADQIHFVELTSMKGEYLLQMAPNATKLNFELSQLKPGFYFLKVQTNNRIYIEKVIKN